MCGIAGYVDFETTPDLRVLDAKTRALAHRGPDERATLIVGACGLAHTRLSVLDARGSQQPMTAASGQAFISFGGEIYNFQQIRAQLESAGQALKTRGDTEVLLQLVARDWLEALPKLDGMFSFAVWDGERQRLLLARDVIGEKPVFYANPSPGVLVFGSEAKAVLEHPGVARDLDPDALRQVLRFRAVYGERSLHAGVRQLRPGCWLEFDASGLRLGRYFHLAKEAINARARLKPQPERAIVEHGRDLFTNSVKARLVADFPVGAFLSGGLDSSLVVAAMREIRGPRATLRTYSAGFDDDPFSELPYARRVAEHLNCLHTEVQVGPETFVARMANLSACRDAPVSEPADVAVAEMSRVAREDVKVVLSGEGADEVFAGYPKYGMAGAPLALRMLVRAAKTEGTARIAGWLGLSLPRTRVAARALSQKSEIERIVQWFSNLDRGELTALLPGLGWSDRDWAATTAEQVGALDDAAWRAADPVLRMQLVDCMTWLPSNMLERDDRMTMLEGLELRSPFLEKNLLIFGLGLPSRLKRRNGVGKWLVRQWAKDVLPERIVDRRKWGFRVPLDLWFRGALRERLEAYLLAEHGLCGAYGDRRAIEALIASHMAGEDRSAALWSLYSTEVWYQDVFKPRLNTQHPELAA